MASLMADMGMEAIFFARINPSKFYDLKSKSNLEFVWKPTFTSGKGNNEIFAHVLHDHYTPPRFVPKKIFGRLG